jgi:hypothetical protein
VRPGIKLAAFAATLAVAFGGAALVGASAPTFAASERAASHDGDEQMSMDEHGPEGLAVSQDGYRLVLDATTAPAGRSELAFRIVGRDGDAVRSFDVEHERPMHVIVVRRDLSSYAHLHPAMDTTGTWRTDLRLPEPGTYRVITDFVPSEDRSGAADGAVDDSVDGGGAADAENADGQASDEDARHVILGTDLVVEGETRVHELPEPAITAIVGDDVVTLDGTPSTDPETELGFRVEGSDGPRALQPYLGAGGHLVAIRLGDMAYAHLHAEELGDDTVLRFGGGLPGAGDYRMFLQYRHDGEVRTATFTVRIETEDER